MMLKKARVAIDEHHEHHDCTTALKDLYIYRKHLLMNTSVGLVMVGGSGLRRGFRDDAQESLSDDR